jgi:hypothetical protein
MLENLQGGIGAADSVAPIRPKAYPGRPIAAMAALIVAASTMSAWATDEIQVYNAEIAKVGQWTIQQHFNYAINGLKQPDFPGGLISHHSLNETQEWGYGVTDWYEMGFYTPGAFDQDGRFYSNGVKLRHLFVTPNADKRDFFYGVNFEFSYSTPKFSESKFNMEIRPIIGVRKNDWEFIVNPIVDIGFGSNGDVTFAPAARLAKNFGEDLAFGLEYYSDLGSLNGFLPFNEQSHQIFGVVDFKVGRFDVNAGLGYGFTGGSDRFMAKMIVGTELNEPEKSEKDGKKSYGMARKPLGMAANTPVVPGNVAGNPFNFLTAR